MSENDPTRDLIENIKRGHADAERLIKSDPPLRELIRLRKDRPNTPSGKLATEMIQIRASEIAAESSQRIEAMTAELVTLTRTIKHLTWAVVAFTIALLAIELIRWVRP